MLADEITAAAVAHEPICILGPMTVQRYWLGPDGKEYFEAYEVDLRHAP